MREPTNGSVIAQSAAAARIYVKGYALLSLSIGDRD